ncbi:hypothetical protein BJY16_005647 [Actinoplanes octamycinicus]|uniref:Uncharacterized protein n=1 Tax=Actinoplanes octamycinicus TaxID=135948 RepID=A0A7W7M9M7_9ACTN|nr:hypothetical protein [Actinoplanes octamycinicus]MBB4742188.1 hypothetical protein [Actinoplanes octamycinicus]GIE59966.1 hypothetical protein Aoc01nite_53680 [Actinoplanes octamycinicus]
MTTITEVVRVPDPRPLYRLTDFPGATPAATTGRLTPFLAPATAADPAPALRDPDRGEHAMYLLRDPFTSP